MTTTTADPFDAATQAGNRPDAHFGRVEVAASFVKLEKVSARRSGRTPTASMRGARKCT